MTTGGQQSSNALEPGKPHTRARDDAEAAIDALRQRGGIFVDAVRSTRMPMVLTDPNLPGNPIVFANPSFLRLSGYSMEEVLGQQPHFLNGVQTDPADADRFRRALERDEDTVIETVQYRKDGSRLLISVFVSAFKDEDGRTLHQFLTYLDVTTRELAEEQLAESVVREAAASEGEAQLHLLFGTQAVWETDASGTVVADSPSWRSYTGQSLEEWLGYGWLGAIHPDDRAYAERQWREAMVARGHVNAEFRLRTPDGGWRWTNVRAIPVLDAAGRIGKWTGINFDIDVRKRAEAALRESEERQAFLLALGDAMRPGGTADDKIGIAARRLGERLGASRLLYAEFDEAKGIADIFNGWLADDAQPFPSVMRLEDYDGPVMDELRAGRTVRIDDVGALLDQPAYAAIAGLGVQALLSVPLFVDGRLVVNISVHQHRSRHWTDEEVGLVEEVAERLWAELVRARAEAALSASEGRLQLALSSTNLGAYEWDLASDRITANDRFAEMIGIGEPLIAARALAEAVHPDDAARVRADLARAMDGGSPGRFVVEHRLASEGPLGERWVLNHRQVYFAGPAEKRQAVRVLGTLLDISERKRADDAVRRNEERQRFLLELNDATRTLTDPVAIAEAVTARLCERLEVNRVLHGEIEALRLTVEQDSTRDVPSIVGEHSMEPFGPDYFKAYEPGAVIGVDDIEQDERLTEGARAGLRERQVAAYVDAVFFEEAGEISLLAVQSATPRTWSDDEKSLIRDVAERARSAIKRVRTENALSASEERFRRFGEASQDVIWIRDADTLQWQYLTPAFEAIYGLSREEALAGDNYRNWLDLIVPEDRMLATANIRRVCAGEHVAFEYRIRRPADGAIRHLRDTDFPIVDENGQVKLIGGIGHDLTGLRETELRLKALVEGIPQLVWRAGEPGHWTWASPQWTEFTGQSMEDSRGWGWLAPVHPDDRELARDAWTHAVERGRFESEYRICAHEAGSYRWFQTRAMPVRDQAGDIIEWLGTSTDVDDLRSLQERQRVLVAELQHRTFNLMGMVRSTADATLRSSGSLDEFRGMFRDRIAALARVQRLLSRLNDEERITFDELIRGELDAAGALQDGDDRVTLAGPTGVALRSSTVQTFAMALHELTTNAVKYGALKQAGAHLDVRWRVEAGAAGRPWLHVEWRETGVSMPPAAAAPQGTGQGRRLIEQALPYQLGARTTYAMAEDGVRCSIALPVSARTSAELHHAAQ